MSIRTFIFCDICNPQALRSIEFRRLSQRGSRTGRRISDGRAWFEGSLEQAIELGGWRRGKDGRHICPLCQETHPEAR